MSVNGRSATSAMNDWLKRIEVSLREDDGGDTADLEFDDTGGRLYLPPVGASVSISLGGAPLFQGFTEEPDWGYARGAGRGLVVHCVAHDSRGALKDPQHWHQDGGTLEDFLRRAAQEAGISNLKVAPAFAGITRPWWSPDGAHFCQLGRRLAAELGGVFRIRGSAAIFAERGAGASVSGAALGGVVFDCDGGAVQRVRARPSSGEQSRSKVRQTWFDRKENRWRQEDVEITPLDGAPPSVAHGRYPRADADRAQRAGKGRRNEAEHKKGGAEVVSDLLVSAVIGAPAQILNARPGVDGTYTIKSVTHRLDRSGGGTSEFELARPEGDAGTDSRAKSGSGSGASQ
ncbi:phage late control D family protein [Xanthobacter sediminis]